MSDPELEMPPPLPSDAQLDAAYTPGDPCPVCKSAMLLRSSRNGSFWGCSAYPRCKTTRAQPPMKVTPLPERHPDATIPLDVLIDRRMRDLLSLCTEPAALTKALEVAADWQKMKWVKEGGGDWGSKLTGGTMNG